MNNKPYFVRNNQIEWDESTLSQDPNYTQYHNIPKYYEQNQNYQVGQQSQDYTHWYENKGNYVNQNFRKQANQFQQKKNYSQQNYNQQPIRNSSNQFQYQQYQNYSQQYPPYFQFQTAFPYLPTYNNLEEIRKKFEPLKDVNKYKVEPGPNDVVKLIRPIKLDNIHKAIKYGIWTSMGIKNIDIIECWKIAAKQKGKVYLVFVPIDSDLEALGYPCNIIGIARMDEEFQPHKHFKYWRPGNKFFGLFNISWVYLKNVPVNDILIQHNNICLTLENLKDGAILAQKDALKVFKSFSEKPEFYDSVFQQFPEFDNQEDLMRQQRQQNKEIEKNFQLKAKQFEDDFKQLISTNFQST